MSDDIKQVGEAFVRTDLDDDVDPIIVAGDGVCCEYCGGGFNPDAVPTTAIPSATLLRCPACERWTEERDES